MNQNQDLVITHCEAELQETRKRAWEDGLSAASDTRSSQTEMKDAHFDKVRRCLVLTEERIHGELGPSPEYLHQEIQRLRSRLSESEPVANPSAAGTPQTDAELHWKFDWRRSLACAAIAGIAAAIAYSAGILNTASIVVLILLASLAVLGPWPIPADLVNAADAVRRARRERKRNREQHALKSAIRRFEDQLSASGLRWKQADLWVETREQLLRAEYEIQRARAARAANRLQISQLVDSMPFNGGSRDDFQEYAAR